MLMVTSAWSEDFGWLVSHNRSSIDQANPLSPRRSVLAAEFLQSVVFLLNIQPREHHLVWRSLPSTKKLKGIAESSEEGCRGHPITFVHFGGTCVMLDQSMILYGVLFSYLSARSIG